MIFYEDLHVDMRHYKALYGPYRLYRLQVRP